MLVLTSSWVYYQNKPGKIRLVFDLSAEFHGISINKALLSGPDLTNQSVWVLPRFREEQIAVTGDIEVIYHRVKVPENKRCFLWFFRWKKSDSSKAIVDHEMIAHIFGGLSPPSCSNFALKKLQQVMLRNMEKRYHLSSDAASMWIC